MAYSDFANRSQANRQNLEQFTGKKGSERAGTGIKNQWLISHFLKKIV